MHYTSKWITEETRHVNKHNWNLSHVFIYFKRKAPALATTSSKKKEGGPIGLFFEDYGTIRTTLIAKLF